MEGTKNRPGRGGWVILFATVAAGIGSAYFLLPGTARVDGTGGEAVQRVSEAPLIDRSEHDRTETAAFGMG